jgi:hypothetical protein
MNKASLEKRHYWQGRIDTWQESGLSVTRWCKENNETQSTFEYWKKLFRQKPKQKSEAGFAELTADTAKDAESGFELHIGQVAIRLRHNFDAPTLSRVLQLLGGLS